jgi:regulator of protease activity HflC (stomatin/prohibitin superfamily)
VCFPQGMNCVLWPCETLAGRVSMRVRQLEVQCATKTKDNVFVTLVVVVQYQVSRHTAQGPPSSLRRV